MSTNKGENRGCDGMRSDGSDCEFPATFPVGTSNGAMRLCMGCICDLRAKGEHTVYLTKRAAP